MPASRSLQYTIRSWNDLTHVLQCNLFSNASRNNVTNATVACSPRMVWIDARILLGVGAGIKLRCCRNMVALMPLELFSSKRLVSRVLTYCGNSNYVCFRQGTEIVQPAATSSVVLNLIKQQSWTVNSGSFGQIWLFNFSFSLALAPRIALALAPLQPQRLL